MKWKQLTALTMTQIMDMTPNTYHGALARKSWTRVHKTWTHKWWTPTHIMDTHTKYGSHTQLVDTHTDHGHAYTTNGHYYISHTTNNGQIRTLSWGHTHTKHGHTHNSSTHTNQDTMDKHANHWQAKTQHEQAKRARKHLEDSNHNYTKRTSRARWTKKSSSSDHKYHQVWL